VSRLPRPPAVGRPGRFGGGRRMQPLSPLCLPPADWTRSAAHCS
jgi:hypothetical protein